MPASEVHMRDVSPPSPPKAPALKAQGRRVVLRRREIQAHVAEPFWYIHVAYQAPDGKSCVFKWDRGHLFDQDIATVLYEACVDDPLAHVMQV